MKMRRVILIFVCGCLFPAEGAEAREKVDCWGWGLALGSPQTLAATLERHGDSPLRLGLHAGSIILVSSVGARAVLISPRERSVAPYAFLGTGLLYTSEGDGGGAVGSSGYGWAGGGARFRLGSLLWSAELGALFGLNEDNGYDPTVLSAAIGVGF